MRFLKILLGLLLILAILILSWLVWHFRDRHRGYDASLSVPAQEAGSLKVGFAAVPISPTVTDVWTDVDGDACYVPENGDRYEDRNNNGRFDPVWMAGFQNRRPATGVHDPLWARTMVIDDGRTRIALVSLDVIGFMSDDVIDVRKQLPAVLGVDYTSISSTHTHEGPDLLGMWGSSDYSSGVDKRYLKYVKSQTAQSIALAVQGLRRARLRMAQDAEGAAYLVEDTRQPQVLDPGLRMIQALDYESGQTIGTLVAWANHPETLWNKNLEITSDFPHYLREGIEKGVYIGDSLVRAGLGGIAVYLNGAIGGLMTTSPEMGIPSIAGDTLYKVPSFDKAAAQGQQLALLALDALEGGEAVEISEADIRLNVRSIELPIDNELYQLAAATGLIDRGQVGWMKVRSEVAYWTLGPASFLHQPGELYPEIANGGVATPNGSDFGGLPKESPPIRNQMEGQFRFIIGLSNDMIGYVIPKTQWDVSAPFTYGNGSAPYGEINSLGPETAPILYREMQAVLR